ncbi:VapE domain-containing protein [Peptostreptococcus anaerobius]
MINIDNIPQELKGLNIWAVHSNKRPFSSKLNNGNLQGTNYTDGSLWASLDDCVPLIGKVYPQYNNAHKIDGLSIRATAPYVFIDLDHVINNRGETLPEAKEIIDILDSYTEVSTSGTGYHILVKTNKPLPLVNKYNCYIELPNNTGWEQTDPDPNHKEKLEIFTGNHVLVFTTNLYQEKNAIYERTDVLHKVFNTYFSEDVKTSHNGTQKVSDTSFIPYLDYNKDIEDKASEIINKLLDPNNLDSIHNKVKFVKVFQDGSIEDYTSYSEADQGLCSIVAKYTNDTQVIDCIYQKSYNYVNDIENRVKKWNRLNSQGVYYYRKSTITKALKEFTKEEKQRLKEKKEQEKQEKINKLVESGFDISDKGKILPTKKSVQTVLDLMGYKFSYNCLDNSITLEGSKDSTEVCITEVYSYCHSIEFNIMRRDLDAYIYNIAQGNMYNPFKDYLNQCMKEHPQPKGEIDRLISTLQYDIPLDLAENRGRIETLYNTLVRKWLISVAALNLVTDLRVKESKPIEGTLVLKGGQGIGKTTWLRNLVPSGYFKEGATLENNKDSKLGIYKYIIVELGELETTTRKQATGFLKNELTCTSVEIRPPYAKETVKTARHTVFGGSVNEDTFLKDTTGNRRFWIIPLLGIDLNTKIDINRLWAEVTQGYILGQPWHLTQEERALLEGLNSQYTDTSYIGMLLESIFDFDETDKDKWVYAKGTAIISLIKEDIPKYVSKNQILGQLRLMGGREKRERLINNSREQTRIWHVPPLRNHPYNISQLDIWEKKDGKYTKLTPSTV